MGMWTFTGYLAQMPVELRGLTSQVQVLDLICPMVYWTNKGTNKHSTTAYPQFVGRQILNLCLLLQASIAHRPADPLGKALPYLVVWSVQSLIVTLA